MVENGNFDQPERGNPFQFSMRDLLVLVTLVAVACSLVRSLGPVAVVPLFVISGPASAAMCLLTRPNCHQDRLLVACAATTGLTWTAMSLAFAAATKEPAGSIGVVAGVAMGIVMGFLGGHIGLLCGAVTVYLRFIWRRFATDMQEALAPESDNGISPGKVSMWLAHARWRGLSRHTIAMLFCSAIPIAVLGLGLGACFGWQGLIAFPALMSPIVALAALAWDNSKHPDRALLAAAAWSAMCYTIGTMVWILVFVPKEASQTPVLSGLVLLPIGGGIFGGGGGLRRLAAPRRSLVRRASCRGASTKKGTQLFFGTTMGTQLD